MILLDTHVAVWLLGSPGRLSIKAREAIVRAGTTGEDLGYCPVSLYEIAYSARRGRLLLNAPLRDFITEMEARLNLIPLTSSISICAAELEEPFHGDPMDRMIAATAIVENCILLTADEEIRRAEVCKTLW
jgi:PIN domain nuclease of toxin-antitoxin system